MRPPGDLSLPPCSSSVRIRVHCALLAIDTHGVTATRAVTAERFAVMGTLRRATILAVALLAGAVIAPATVATAAADPPDGADPRTCCCCPSMGCTSQT